MRKTIERERAIVTKVWPEHAEICSDADWKVITNTVKEDQPLSKSVIEPVGEAKDTILASLTILYWTMKLVQLGIQIHNEVSNIPKPQRAKAVIDAITKRMSSDTPKLVSDKIEEIVNDIEQQ